MKFFPLGFTLMLFVSCATYDGVTEASFVQDEVEISLPVLPVKLADGNIVYRAFMDGGTVGVTVRDAKGRIFVIYHNHRIGFKNTWGDFYVHNLPGLPGAVHIRDKKRFQKSVLRHISLPPN